MNPASLLSLVTARAKPFEITASSFHRINPEDVLHAMGNIKHEGASLLIRVKWADQKQFTYDLELLFWMAIVNLAQSEKWPYPMKMNGKEFYRNLGRLALSENINPNICLECGGCGKEITEEGKLQDCRPCRGSGKSHHSDRSRARLLGMPWETFRNPWADKYKKIQGMADIWESIALSSISRKFQQTA